jgi:glucose-6-phosphate 1-dehydrogenase
MSTPKLNIVVIGASGHLARTKIYPALFSLYCQGFLPDDFHIAGYARSSMTQEIFRERITEKLTCRYSPEGDDCSHNMEAFLGRCCYHAGQYDSGADFSAMANEAGLSPKDNTLFYLAVPPNVFYPVAEAIREAGLAGHAEDPWTRIVIEKPFGRDRASSDELTEQMGHVFSETQVFRIDHYLGKEVIQNLMVLRFANLIFEPIWNRDYVESVQITWQENKSIEGRGGYFDEVGIIRDVMQNHLLQILALVAMEPPSRLGATHIQDEKVRVLKCISPPGADEVVTGQFVGTTSEKRTVMGYKDDPTVPDDSNTPTYAATVMHVVNRRWDGVPFLMIAGKGMDASANEIRIQFRDVPANMFRLAGENPSRNALVINVQPDASIYFEIVAKVPGVGMKLDSRLLDLRYASAFNEIIPDAYEDLLLDVINGEKSLFIREDELAASWDVFTPLLKQIEAGGVSPVDYPFGSKSGPEAAAALAERHGMTLTDFQASKDAT